MEVQLKLYYSSETIQEKKNVFSLTVVEFTRGAFYLHSSNSLIITDFNT